MNKLYSCRSDDQSRNVSSIECEFEIENDKLFRVSSAEYIEDRFGDDWNISF